MKPIYRTPIERFEKSITEDNLWIYILSLALKEEICDQDVPRLIFEKFGFLTSKFTATRVLKHLKEGEYIRADKRQGKRSYIATEKGKAELKNMKAFVKKTSDILEKI
jgi:DNA-binding PadR family transcriptional regulator